MHVDQLYQLLALVKAGGFRKACKTLHISQPALSKSIQRLEQLFETPIVDRLPTGVVPTESGKVILEWARAVTTSFENTRRYINLTRDLFTGTITIGADPYFEDFGLGPVIGRLVDKHPQLKFKVIVDSWKNMEELLFNQTIDLYLGSVDHLKHSRDIELLSLVREPIVIFCRPGHPLLGKKQAKLKDILDYPATSPFTPGKIDGLLRKTLKDEGNDTGIWNFEPTVQVGNYTTLRKIVLTSNCIGELPESCIKPVLEKGELVKLPFSIKDLFSEISIAYLKDRTATSILKIMFEQVLFEELKKERDKN